MRWDVCHRGHPSDGKDEAKALGEIGGMHGDFEAKVVWSEGWEISCLLISMHACMSISSILRKASSICWCIYSPWGRVVIGPGNVVTYWLRRGRSNYLFKGVMEERIKKLNILTLINVGDPAFYFYFFNLTGVIFFPLPSIRIYNYTEEIRHLGQKRENFQQWQNYPWICLRLKQIKIRKFIIDS